MTSRASTTRRILEIVGEDGHELLHRLLIEIIERDQPDALAALDAALAGFAAARHERAAGLEALAQLQAIARKARHG